MINTKRPSTDDYTQVGFVEAKDIQGNYQNIDHIYDNQGNIVFQQGYLNEYQGADNFGIPAIGKPLLDYTIYGNTVQNGTPTPDNPIMPQGCGERTANLFDAATAYGSMYNDGVVSGTTYNVYLILNHFNESQVGKQITISIRADKVTASRIFIETYIAGTVYASNSIYTGNTGVMQITVTPQSTSDSWRISYGSNANDECILSNIMLNLGSTPLPYEPYGIKIPISSEFCISTSNVNGV